MKGSHWATDGVLEGVTMYVKYRNNLKSTSADETDRLCAMSIRSRGFQVHALPKPERCCQSTGGYRYELKDLRDTDVALLLCRVYEWIN